MRSRSDKTSVLLLSCRLFFHIPFFFFLFFHCLFLSLFHILFFFLYLLFFLLLLPLFSVYRLLLLDLVSPFFNFLIRIVTGPLLLFLIFLFYLTSLLLFLLPFSCLILRTIIRSRSEQLNSVLEF
jgi:hypothetical protein